MIFSSFCLPVTSKERCSLGTSVLFAVAVFVLAVNQKLPVSSDYLPAVNLYLFFIMAVSAFSIGLTITNYAIHYQTLGYNNGQKPLELPSFFRLILWIRRKFFATAQMPRIKVTRRKYFIKKLRLKKLRKFHMAILLDADKIATDVYRHFGQSFCTSFVEGINWASRAKEFQTPLPSERGQMLLNNVYMIKEMVAGLERLVRAYDRQIDSIQLQLQWQEMAQFFDDILFWLFAAVSGGAVFFALGISYFQAESDYQKILDEIGQTH